MEYLFDDKRCKVCGDVFNLELHHIFFGSANRKQSEKYGLVCWLCPEHHRGKSGVHQFRELDIALKQAAQMKFEEEHAREEFRAIFGKSWL